MNGPCAQCGRINATSPSEWFCGDICQQEWHRKQALAMGPWDARIDPEVARRAAVEAHLYGGPAEAPPMRPLVAGPCGNVWPEVQNLDVEPEPIGERR